MKVNVCVIGAGVIGLSTAVQLTEARFPGADTRVTLIAEKFSPDTTSDGSGGIWDPTLCGVYTTTFPPPNVAAWALETFTHSTALARSEAGGEAGASMVTGNSYFSNPEGAPYWRDIVYNFKMLTPHHFSRLPHCTAMGFKYGYNLQTVIVDCLKYLPYLMKRFLKNGGNIRQKRITRLDELACEFDVVVNCTGLEARDLVPDASTHARKGQTVCVEAPWIKHFTTITDGIQNEKELTYIIPKASYVVLGGTHEHHVYDTTPDVQQRERILRESCKLEPSLKGAKILRDWVGLRPGRFEVRVERENLNSENGKLHVVHNYGHGGSGVTLHWGCAKEATQLVQQCIMEMSSKL